MNSKMKVLSVLLLLLATQFVYGQKNEIEKVRKSFENYQKAILNENGEEAVKYVDSVTVKYYADMLYLVRTADSAKVETLSILDKLMVFSIRHRTSRENIISFDGKSLLVYAIKSGMIGKNSVSKSLIGEVTIESNLAKGQFVTNGQKTPYFFNFHKEEGEWKLDITSLFSITTMAFTKMAENSGESQNDFLFSMLELSTGKKPDNNIWKPVN
jgi:hypothetical protein